MSTTIMFCINLYCVYFSTSLAFWVLERENINYISFGLCMLSTILNIIIVGVNLDIFLNKLIKLL